jgi:hypothetical protein
LFVCIYDRTVAIFVLDYLIYATWRYSIRSYWKCFQLFVASIWLLQRISDIHHSIFIRISTHVKAASVCPSDLQDDRYKLKFTYVKIMPSYVQCVQYVWVLCFPNITKNYASDNYLALLNTVALCCNYRMLNCFYSWFLIYIFSTLRQAFLSFMMDLEVNNTLAYFYTAYICRSNLLLYGT